MIGVIVVTIVFVFLSIMTEFDLVHLTGVPQRLTDFMLYVATVLCLMTIIYKVSNAFFGVSYDEVIDPRLGAKVLDKEDQAGYNLPNSH